MNAIAITISDKTISLFTWLKNGLSFVILKAVKPFAVGDYISLRDVSGFVKHIGVQETVLKTLQNGEIVVPNGHINAKWALHLATVKASGKRL